MECSHECEYEDEPCITLDCLEDILKKISKTYNIISKNIE